MNIFGQATPNYRGVHVQPRATGGLMSSLFGNLLGRTAASYRTVDDRRVNAQTSASWWQALSSTPSYKTALRASEPLAPIQEVAPDCDARFADNGELSAEQTCVCAPMEATQVVILDE